MRLRDMKQLLNDNVDNLEYTTQEAGGNVFVLKGTRKVVEAIEELKQLNFLATEIGELSSLANIYHSRAEPDEIRVNSGHASKFKSTVNEIYTKAIAVLDAIDQAIPDQEENSISVKLPDYTDLNQLSKFFNKLNTALEQAIKVDQIKGSVTIQNFDSGSLWVELVINGGAKAIGFVGSLTYAATVVSKKMKENKLMQAQIDALNLRNELLEEISTSTKKQLDAVVEAETKNLLGEQKIQCDREDLERIKLSVKTLAELIFKGTEIQPSLNAPETTAEKFPDFTKISTIQSSVKQIETDESKE